MKPYCPCINDIAIQLVVSRCPQALSVLGDRLLGVDDINAMVTRGLLHDSVARDLAVQIENYGSRLRARCVPQTAKHTLCGRAIAADAPTCYPDCQVMRAHPLCPDCFAAMLSPKTETKEITQ